MFKKNQKTHYKARQVQNQDLINQSADSFVAEARQIFQKYDDDNIHKTDQMGVEVELHSHIEARRELSTMYIQSVQQHTHILFNKQPALVGTSSDQFLFV